MQHRRYLIDLALAVVPALAADLVGTAAAPALTRHLEDAARDGLATCTRAAWPLAAGGLGLLVSLVALAVVLVAEVVRKLA